VTSALPAVLAFYDQHPINEGQVLASLRRQGKDPGRLSPEDLWDWDQDHYGGVPAALSLARRAGVGRGSRVLDVCAGLAGPARVLAHCLGAHVVALDLHAGRCAAARRLTHLVGLGGRVRVVRGDAQALPFPRAAFTAVVSQEGLLHVPDKPRVLAECARVLVPGGRLAFSDWIATPRLAEGERARLGQWMAAFAIQSVAGYRQALGRAGFVSVETEDLSAEWVVILRERLAMYRSLRPDMEARFGRERADQYDQLYAFFVGLVEAGKLGGARFSATASPAHA
jgi:SAM-dependent methyltransferase